tara:strand:+ start:59 stop:1096 length:1038 start_codon:yes stop_codon:yes gene_type:complete
MELYEREFFIAKVFRGYVKHKVDKDLYIYIHPPTIDEYIEAQDIFMESYEEAMNQNMMSSEECLAFMMDNNIWNAQKEEYLEKLGKEIDKLKVSVFTNYFNSQKREHSRVVLNQTKELLNKLYTEKHSYDHTTDLGVATYSKNAWLVENCTKYKDRTLYDWKHMDVQKAMHIQSASSLSEEQIREIAKTSPWQGYWSLKDEEGNIFKKHPMELTNNQQHLISWSRAYNNVNESPDCPVDEIIQDNDAFDGWMIKQREDRDSQKGEKMGEDIASKHTDANEVFIYSSTPEDAEKVNNLNNPAVKMLKKQRMNKIDSDQSVKYQDFNDVRMTLTETLHDMSKNRGKG